MSRQFQTPSTVVAAFPDPDRAKSAMAALERSGTPSRDVRLLNDVTGVSATAARRADERKFGWVTRRWLLGAVVGAVVGAVIMIVVVAAFYGSGPILRLVGSAFGGALFGGVVGALVWVGVGTPRNRHAWDTYLVDHHDETCLAVAVRRESDDDQISTILRREGAVSLEHVPSTGGA
jgi:hypothetical protein